MNGPARTAISARQLTRKFGAKTAVDHIDLDVAFADLTITTVSPGTVRIVHSGEVLLVSDLAGVLTAANFTAADFL